MELDLDTLHEAEKVLIPDSFNLLKLAYEMSKSPKKEFVSYTLQDRSNRAWNCISFEGINCSGKSTQSSIILRNNKNSQIQKFQKEEDLIPFKILKASIAGRGLKDYDPLTWSLIFSSLYLQRLSRLDKRKIYLMDRGIDTSVVLQTRRLELLGLGAYDSISWLLNLISPNQSYMGTFYLELDSEEAISRRKKRGDNQERTSSLSEKRSFLEDQIRLYNYLDTHFNRMYVRYSANESINELSARIQAKINEMINLSEKHI
jgi:thymidylate kinase